MIGLLRQISSQTHNYTLTSTHVNSSTPFVDSSASSFVPRSTDIRVNVCWFASLVFSLSSASFGILVKQWLREYLAIDHVMAPQERARLRYFRTLGLKDWRLFEIAAILPLILQLALAFFFSLGYVSLLRRSTEASERRAFVWWRDGQYSSYSLSSPQYPPQTDHIRQHF